jgi:hypothetical protein
MVAGKSDFGKENARAGDSSRKGSRKATSGRHPTNGQHKETDPNFKADTNERELLCCMLRDNQCVASLGVTAEDFRVASHQLIFRAMHDLVASGRPATLDAIANLLLDRRQVEYVPYKYLGGLWDATQGYNMPTHFARLVREEACRRSLILKTADIKRAAEEGCPLLDLANDLHEQTARLQALVEGQCPSNDPRRFRFKVIDSAAFDATDYRPEFLAKKTVVKGQPLVFGGPLKCLKTSMSVDMAVSLSSATPFLGEFAVYRKVRVVILSGESGTFALQSIARRVCEERGIRLSDCNTDWGFELPQFSSEPDLRELQNGLRNRGAEVCVLDPLYMGLLSGPDADPSSASNLYATGPLLLALAQSCLEVKVTPAICHHFRRHIPDPPAIPELHWLSHSGIAEFARQWLLVSRREPFDPDVPNKLWLSAGGSVGHSGLYAVDIDEGKMADDFTGRTWKVSVQGFSEAQEAKADQQRADKEKQQTEKHKEKRVRLLQAVDALAGKDGIASYNQAKVRACLNTDDMTRAVMDLADVLEEVEITVGVGVKKKGKLSAKGLKRRRPSDLP